MDRDTAARASDIDDAASPHWRLRRQVVLWLIVMLVVGGYWGGILWMERTRDQCQPLYDRFSARIERLSELSPAQVENALGQKLIAPDPAEVDRLRYRFRPYAGTIRV